jgi:penicillin-binding protein 1C
MTYRSGRLDVTRGVVEWVTAFVGGGGQRRLWAAAAAVFAGGVLWLLWPPDSPFPDDYSRLVYDCHGRLLRATLAADEQLRFPPLADTLPVKYRRAVVEIEDRRFFYHPGVDPIALAGAMAANVRQGKRVRGGSTITMQVMRLSDRRPRTYVSKLVESLLALKLSLHRSKREVLALYAAHVPMGGNTVGVESAAYRYFGKPLGEITWAEAALFAVLPNAPSAINIETRRPQLKTRRDRALELLHRRGVIDSLTCVLSCAEPLPGVGSHVPFDAPHFTTYALAQHEGALLRSSLDAALQARVQSQVGFYAERYARAGVHNVAVVVAETATGRVRAYLGSGGFDDAAHAGQVDGVQAPRSTGSLLKPILVAKAIDRGPFCMQTMVQDVPTFYGVFAPRNASKSFDGLVTVEQMLIRSLNVPAVRLLHAYGLERFHGELKAAGLSHLFRTAAGYGLPLILGGAEASLWDLTALFAGLGNGGARARLTAVESADGPDSTERLCSAGAAWLVTDALAKLDRPGSECYWHLFSDQVRVAWKTGTSYGQKDAWAIGVNRQWTIGVWVGNFSGEGNAMLGGAQTAGPILFALFNALTDRSRAQWFEKPEADLVEREVCPVSGYTPSPACTSAIRVLTPGCAYQRRLCPYHRRVCTSRLQGYEVCSRCWQPDDTVWSVKATYPPSAATVLTARGVVVDSVPRHNPSCQAVHRSDAVEILYPVPEVSIIVPRNLRGEYEKIVLKAGCRHASGSLFWYLDGAFVGETVGEHNVAVDLSSGEHRLVVQDGTGGTSAVVFDASRHEQEGP